MKKSVKLQKWKSRSMKSIPRGLTHFAVGWLYLHIFIYNSLVRFITFWSYNLQFVCLKMIRIVTDDRPIFIQECWIFIHADVWPPNFHTHFLIFFDTIFEALDPPHPQHASMNFHTNAPRIYTESSCSPSERQGCCFHTILWRHFYSNELVLNWC